MSVALGGFVIVIVAVIDRVFVAALVNGNETVVVIDTVDESGIY